MGVFVGVSVGAGSGVGQTDSPITVTLPFWLATPIDKPVESARATCVRLRALLPPQDVAKRTVARTPLPVGPAEPVIVQPNCSVPTARSTLGPTQSAMPPVLSGNGPLNASTNVSTVGSKERVKEYAPRSVTSSTAMSMTTAVPSGTP